MKIREVLTLSMIFLLTGCESSMESRLTSCTSITDVHARTSDPFSGIEQPVKLSSQMASNSIFNVFDTSLWPARWNCGIWTDEHGWLYIGSDLAIWLAYFTIPFILGFFYLRQREEIPFRSVFLLFIAFIVACGLTHFIDALIFWWPAYKLSAFIRFGTAIISWGAVFALVKVVPQVLQLKGPATMQSMIDEKIDELTRLNLKLNEEIEKRREAEASLLTLNENLEEAIEERTYELKAINEELNAFSYSVSHDLRSPLRSISGFSQALREDCFAVLDDNGKNYLNRISNAAIRMGKLIDELLELSRISRKDIVLEDIDFTALCKDIIEEYADEKKYSFSVQENLTAYGDIKLFRIMMENLIDNAIKYSSKLEHPIVEIGERDFENEGHVFFIKDNGAGFDPEYADRLFGAFQRLHAVEEFEGVGIGLATVKRIINKHGGYIWAESQVDKGATFYFNLNN